MYNNAPNQIMYPLNHYFLQSCGGGRGMIQDNACDQQLYNFMLNYVIDESIYEKEFDKKIDGINHNNIFNVI